MNPKTFAINDQIAVLDSNNDIHYGVVTAVKGDDVQVSIPTLRGGKGYAGGYAVERLFRVNEAEAARSARLNEIEMVNSVFMARR